MSSNVTPGPNALYNNPPIKPQYYSPREKRITALSTGASTVVTTATDNQFVIGQLVRLLIPTFYGSFQLNGLEGYVTAKPASNQVVININSTQANAFVPSPAYGPNPPQIIPIGDVNSGVINQGSNRNQTFIDGSFINISPL